MAIQIDTREKENKENTFTSSFGDMEFIQLPAGQGIESVEYDGKIYKPGEFIKLNNHEKRKENKMLDIPRLE